MMALIIHDNDDDNDDNNADYKDENLLMTGVSVPWSMWYRSKRLARL